MKETLLPSTNLANATLSLRDLSISADVQGNVADNGASTSLFNHPNKELAASFVFENALEAINSHNVAGAASLVQTLSNFDVEGIDNSCRVLQLLSSVSQLTNTEKFEYNVDLVARAASAAIELRGFSTDERVFAVLSNWSQSENKHLSNYAYLAVDPVTKHEWIGERLGTECSKFDQSYKAALSPDASKVQFPVINLLQSAADFIRSRDSLRQSHQTALQFRDRLIEFFNVATKVHADVDESEESRTFLMYISRLLGNLFGRTGLNALLRKLVDIKFESTRDIISNGVIEALLKAKNSGKFGYFNSAKQKLASLAKLGKFSDNVDFILKQASSQNPRGLKLSQKIRIYKDALFDTDRLGYVSFLSNRILNQTL